MSQLQDAIEGLYAAFAKVRKPRHIEACPCCQSSEEIAILLSKEVRSISADEISRYASSAIWTVGTSADYLYFLPRILEIHSFYPDFIPIPESTAGQICRTSLQDWPAPRLQALENYVRQILNNALSPNSHHRIDSWMCAASILGFDIRVHLNAIGRMRPAVLVYFNANASTLPERLLSNSYWHLPNESHDVIVDWFYSPPIKKLVFDAYGYVFND